MSTYRGIPCKCQAELGDLVWIAEVLLLDLSSVGLPWWDLCECQGGFGDIAKITVATVSFWGVVVR